MTRFLDPISIPAGALLVVCGLLAGCGADGTSAPRNQAPSEVCNSLDETASTAIEILSREELSELTEVIDRLESERDGTRVERLVLLILGALQALPREEATTFEFEIIIELVESTRDMMTVVLEFFAYGPDENRLVFPLLSTALLDCPRDTFILTVRDFFNATDLMASLGGALEDPLVVELLLNIPDQPEEGRDGFVALVRTMFNAILSPNFEFSEIRALLSFLNLDEPPMSELLEAAEAYLQGENLEHLRATITCLQVTEHDGMIGVDIIGGLLFDLLSDDDLDTGSLLTIAAPLIEQIQDPQTRTLLSAVLEALVEDLALREVTIDLLVFFLREDNLPVILEAAVPLISDGGIDSLVLLMAGLTVRCPDPPPEYAVSDE